MIGRTLSHYEILEKLGEGGMGEVYRAVDQRLGRQVAIKVLPPWAVGDRERRERLVQEARAASALNHPNIVTIYGIERGSVGEETVDIVAMELVEGEPLDRRIPAGGLPLAEALGYGVEVASALAAAHEAGIVHRDLKPANLMVNRAGHVKVLDFGLAKLTAAGDAGTEAPTLASPVVTQRGAILGTPAYMSPEQATGKPVDPRSDVFSLGAVLYEMVTGARPFAGQSSPEVLAAMLERPLAPLRTARPEAPADLERIVARCLERDPAARYPSAADLLEDLTACKTRWSAPVPSLRALLRRPRVLVPVAAAIVLLAVLATWLGIESSRRRWARTVALPEIARMVAEGELFAAYRLATRAQGHLSGDPQLESLWARFAFPATVRTEPPGAEVWLKDYLKVDEPWELLGRSPIEGHRVPIAPLRFRIEKEGYEPLEAAPPAEPADGGVLFDFTLVPVGAAPNGMVRVPGGRFRYRQAPPVELEPFWIDRLEVTNRQFQEFVDAGGYRRPELWPGPFVEEGRTLAWEEAVERFRDATGRPGPATWELGAYLEGQGDLPVRGVSWHEAAAYATWAGKSLPTLHHWFRAAAPDIFSEILLLSNFGGEGPATVGSHPGLGPYGTFDMAGNVQEWTSSRTGDRHYILGGAWSDPSYLFDEPEVASPFAREETFGFRCVQYSAPLPAAQQAPIDVFQRDYRQERPVPDEVFAAIRGVYAYDRTPLDAVVEAIDDSPPHWRLEKVSFDAAYGGERVSAYLFLPRNTTPPFQTVLYFPTSQAEALRTSAHLEQLRWFDFIVRSGRALVQPVYKGTYERRVEGGPTVASVRRDLVIQWAKDLGRTIDYLETRPDIDAGKLAFYGFSLGATYGPILTAVEERLRAAIFLAGGFTGRPLPPEAEVFNFAPRIRVPVLMVGGRHDFVRPVESAQQPLFDLLGTPPEDKRLALLEGGHVPQKLHGIVKEILDWLDRYLGPVSRDQSPARP